MPVEVGLWRVDGETPMRIRSTGIELETQLERLIEQDPAILGDPLLLIGRQVPTSMGGFVDLLAIDADGNLHVLELKRDRTPRDVVAQVLDYGSWASGLSNQDVRELYESYRAEIAFDVAFSDVFGERPPDDLNSSHHLTVVAHDADAATERIVNYLSSYAVPVNILFFRYFEDDGRPGPVRDAVLAALSSWSDYVRAELQRGCGHGRVRGAGPLGPHPLSRGGDPRAWALREPEQRLPAQQLLHH